MLFQSSQQLTALLRCFQFCLIFIIHLFCKQMDYKMSQYLQKIGRHQNWQYLFDYKSIKELKTSYQYFSIIKTMKKKNQTFASTQIYKDLSFNCELDEQHLLYLEKKKGITSKMMNQKRANLSKQNWKGWVYSGNARIYAQDKSFPSKNIQNEVLTESSNDSSAIQLNKVPFVNLLKKTQWETLWIRFQKGSHIYETNLIKQLSCIDFPNLIQLALVADNISSIQLFQTINFPNLQNISLNYNKITNMKSFFKTNIIKLKKINLNGNFLNIQKTYQCFTKLDAPKLQGVFMQIQEEQNFLLDIQRSIRGTVFINGMYETNEKSQYFKECIQQQGQYAFQSSQEMLENLYYRYRVEPKNLSQKVDEIFHDQKKKSIQILDFLLRQCIQAQLYKFLLKSNSQTQQILCTNYFDSYRHHPKYSPYQFFVDFSTNIDKFIQLYQMFLQKGRQYYETSEQYGCPCCNYRCCYCDQYRCVCIKKSKIQDKIDEFHEKKGFYYK